MMPLPQGQPDRSGTECHSGVCVRTDKLGHSGTKEPVCHPTHGRSPQLPPAAFFVVAFFSSEVGEE